MKYAQKILFRMGGAALLASLSLASAHAAPAVFNTGADFGMGKDRHMSTDIRAGVFHNNDVDYDYRDNNAAYVVDNGDVVIYDQRNDRFFTFNRVNDVYVPHQHVVYTEVSDPAVAEGQVVLLDTNNDGIVDTRARILYSRSVNADMRAHAYVWEGGYPYLYVP